MSRFDTQAAGIWFFLNGFCKNKVGKRILLIKTCLVSGLGRFGFEFVEGFDFLDDSWWVDARIEHNRDPRGLGVGLVARLFIPRSKGVPRFMLLLLS